MSKNYQITFLTEISDVKFVQVSNRFAPLVEIVEKSILAIKSEFLLEIDSILLFTAKGELLISQNIHFNKQNQLKAGHIYELVECEDGQSNFFVSPILDKNQELIGYLALAVNNPTTKLIGALLKAMAVNIENELITQKINYALEESNQYAFAIMNNLASGVITIDLLDRIHWINDTACRILNIRRIKLVNKPISAYFPQWSKVKQIVHNDGTYIDEESRFDHKEIHGNFLFNAYPIKSTENLFIGYILTFRSFSRVFKTVEKLSGMQAKYHFEDIVCDCEIMQRQISYAKSIANNGSTVLIEGESGTGKELFAQSIHNSSPRLNHPFVAINCGAISPTLIEAELFGYEEGAFTGAQKGGRIGKFEQANGGTLFLDEIGEMPLDMQVKLLRALQEKNITKVGSVKAIPVDVRIIAATNRDLQEEIKNGNFRQDLFFRLHVLPLRVPALRERGDDVVLLFKYFIRIKAAKFNKALPQISVELEGRVRGYDWPGNVRELENFCERLLIVGESGLNSILTYRENSHQSELQPPVHQVITPSSYNQSLEELERDYIAKILEQEEYNMTKVAKILDISRNTLYLKVKKYKIKLLRPIVE